MQNLIRGKHSHVVFAELEQIHSFYVSRKVMATITDDESNFEKINVLKLVDSDHEREDSAVAEDDEVTLQTEMPHEKHMAKHGSTALMWIREWINMEPK